MAERPVVLGNSIYERLATAPPVFRSSTPGSRGCCGERRLAETRLRRRKRLLSLKQVLRRDPKRPRPLDDSAVEEFVL
jgi:hypothetical protein